MIITRRPEKTIEGRPITWQAVFSPIIFELQTDIPGTYIQTEIYEVGSDLLLARFYTVPVLLVGSEDYTAKISVSAYLQAYVRGFETSAYANKNVKDIPVSVRYYCKFQEFEGSAPVGAEIDDMSNQYTAVYAVRQPGEPAELTDLQGVNANNQAKFLTDFEIPVYFEGYPFDLSWINSEDLADLTVRAVESQYQGAVQISQTEIALDNNDALHVNRLRIEEPVSGVTRICVFLRTGDVVPVLYVYPGYIDDGYVESQAVV